LTQLFIQFLGSNYLNGWSLSYYNVNGESSNVTLTT